MGIYDGMDTSYMDSGNWSGTDVSGAPDYASGQLNTPDMSTWDSSQAQQMNPQQGQFNFEDQLSNSPLQGWQQNGTDWSSVDQQLGSNFSNPMIDAYNRMPSMNQAQNVLANIFNNNKGVVTGLGALAEGYQNKKKAATLQQLVSRMQPAMDPFGAQRPQYQAELSRAVQNPYSSPIVQQQVNALQQAQQIRDAAAGRRSNSATSSPALMAAQAQVAQNYINSLYTPSGADIGPKELSSLLSAQQQGINAGINGYISPAIAAQQRQNQEDLLMKLFGNLNGN